MKFAFDIGFSSIGYAANSNYKKFKNDLPVWAGVWLFDNENYKSKLNAIKREKRRKRKRKEKLKKVRKLLGITLDEEFKNLTKDVWTHIRKSKQSLTRDEFNAILYHFAKNRGYIDMRKIKTDDKDDGVIKTALKTLSEVKGENIFEKLLGYRDELIEKAVKNLNEKFNINEKKSKEFLEYYMPYRNKEITGLIKKINEKFKINVKNAKELFENEMNYYFIMQNKDIADAIININSRYNFLDEKILKEYIALLTDKGNSQSLEDKIGWCESGELYKRSGKHTYDMEKFRVIELWKKLVCIDKENNEFFVKECMTFEEFYKRILEHSNSEITRSDLKKILKDLKIKDFKQTNKKFLYLNAHCLYSSLSDKRILNDEEFRDEVEYTLLFHSDTAQREEKLKNHFNKDDLEKIINHDTGKPSFLSNKVCRAILPQLMEKDITDVLNEYKAKNLKFLNRNYLSFKEWKKNTQYNNPYLENIVKNFIKLFNHLVQNFGSPDEIIIESARDFAISEKEKKEKDKKLQTQMENEKNNRMIKDFLDNRFSTKPKDYGKLVKRLKLFLEQNKDLKVLKDNSISYCPITGEFITIEDALDGNKTNIDHIIPQSVIVDNSYNNTILISSRVNQKEKIDLTPVEYIAKSKNISVKEAAEILEENLKKTKIKKGSKKYSNFFVKNAKEFKYELKGFDLRHLQATHFGVKEIKELIIRQYHFNNFNLSYHERASKIIFTNGKLTSFLRKIFIPKYNKDRKYYINHLVDALVLLNIDKSMQQHIHTLANKYINEEVNKQKEFINFIREEYFDKKNIQAKFDIKEAVKFFEEKFDALELGAYREEVRKLKKRYLKETILSKKELQKEKSAVLTPSGYRKKDKGFKRILVCKNTKGKSKFKIIVENYFDKNNKQCNALVAELFRYSLIKIKDEMGYVVGGDKSNNKIEIIPVNIQKEKRSQISASNFQEKLNINPLGVIKK
jgi:CRISPR subtype II RNA-guided endonuclease Cas9/Csn1